MNWVIHFLDFIDINKLMKWGDKTLLAVSGGGDSVAMVHMFHMADLDFAIAHCNFNLRSEESDEDEEFCRKLAQKYNVSFFSVKFDTHEYAKTNKCSIQLAARELRYEWLEETRKKHNIALIATAHHLDDNTETMLFNIARGAGYKGISGIPINNNNIIRPLLVFQKSEISEFINKHKLLYREDSSNLSKKYTRNKIRLDVIPVLKDINPRAIRHFSGLAGIVRRTEDLLGFLLDKENILVKHGNEYHIQISKINEYPERETVLFHLLKRFGFSASEAKLINKTIKSQPGKFFESENYLAIRDRDAFIISEKKGPDLTDEIKIEPYETYKLANDMYFESEVINYMPDVEISKENNYVSLDFDMLKFPLILRKWQQGDSFQPFGMKGNKKVSDYLIDIKMPLHKKEEVLVLVSGNDIIWIVKQRPDNRYAIRPTTNKIFIARTFSE